ncbi:hypothetical protein NBRC3188_2554 [Acetobacter pasteurianus NBRC 3188]|uniref:Uncharacterized protein n=1 Tax=Acetobacter pasteurianus NBRC 3188 TaxID=1226663 RepID=A0A401WWW9_ACEPA|nr:hypothetical protein NBRC3188_2554 [Acetobacter pasteurianus NBRC 3188]
MQQQKAVGLRHNIDYLFDRGSNGQNSACVIGWSGRADSERSPVYRAIESLSSLLWSECILPN